MVHRSRIYGLPTYKYNMSAQRWTSLEIPTHQLAMLAQNRALPTCFIVMLIQSTILQC